MPGLNAIEPLTRTLPLWAVAMILTVATLLALEAGSWWGRRQHARSDAHSERGVAKSDAQGYIIGSIFGLLAFLIGLTFSMALDRFDDRRGWVAEEATAISTAYLRADLFDEPFRSDLRATLREYTHSRIVPDGISVTQLGRLTAQSEAIRGRLWHQTRAAVFPLRDSELGESFVEAMNNALVVGTRRRLAGLANVPTQVLDILFLYLLVSSAALGSLMGKEGNRQRYSSSMLIILFVLGITLILDIDRPRGGSIKVSQQALQQLAGSMDADAQEQQQNSSV